MTSLIFAVIMAVYPVGDAQEAKLIAAKPDTMVEQPQAEPRIHEPEKALKNFHHLLKNDKLTLPGIVVEEPSKEK